MEIIQQLITKNLQSGLALSPEYFTVHETDNSNKGADAQAHANLQSRGNDRDATWHFQVDKNKIIQSVPDNVVAFAAGDGRNGPGNRKSLHGEICVNSDGDYRKAVENMAWLVRVKIAQHKIPLANVVQHNRWSGKNCPRHLRAGDWGITWPQFLGMLKTNQSGWVKESGKWYFYVGGVKRSGWILDKGSWYYLDAAGVMLTGWVKDKGKWYYLNPNGDMRVGWLKDGDKWYYLDQVNGDMKTGWLRNKNKWYYLYADGSMATGEITVAGKKYQLRPEPDGSLIITNSSGEIVE